MRGKLFFIGCLMYFLTGCVGTDFVDDEVLEQEVMVVAPQQNVVIGGTIQLSAVFTDEFGVEQSVNILWASTDPSVATVDQTGLVTAIGSGQTSITASFEETTSEVLLITVVENENDVAAITIESEATVFSEGETIQLSAQAFNINGIELTNQQFTWGTNDAAIVTIDNDGLATAVAEGTTTVWAEIGDLRSDPIELTVGAASRTAEFGGRNGYVAEGIATLAFNDDNELILTFSDDFVTDFALGTFIYLSNTTSGSGTRANGLELGEIRTNGAKTFNVTVADPEAGLDDYRYVIVLCRPASITFGVADLQME
ncbi:MAG: Ig-like domain-containing protein [Bacteroidota bacterium]